MRVNKSLRVHLGVEKMLQLQLWVDLGVDLQAQSMKHNLLVKA